MDPDEHRDRALSPVIGAVVIFGFLIAALALYQVNVVPAQNEVVELTHYNDVRTDMVEIRNAVVEASQTQTTRSATIELGADYHNRLFTANPPDPTGTIRSEQVGTGEITATNVNTSAICGLGPETTTKALVYEPHYNYLQTNESAPPIVYEHSLLYRTPSSGQVLQESGQTLVQGTTINLAPLVGNVSETSSQARAFDFQSPGAGSTGVSQSFTLTIPTRLSASTWENDVLAGQSAVQSVTTNGSRPSAVDINFEPGFYTVRCAAVGSDGQPDLNITSEEGANEINPTEAGDIKLEDVSRGFGPNDHVVTLSLNNTAGLDVEVRRARINFYQDVIETGNAPENAQIQDSGGTPSATLLFEEPFENLSPRITLTGNGTVTDVRLEFFANAGQTQDGGISDRDWFVVTMAYSNGETETYFIGIPG